MNLNTMIATIIVQVITRRVGRAKKRKITQERERSSDSNKAEKKEGDGTAYMSIT